MMNQALCRGSSSSCRPFGTKRPSVPIARRLSVVRNAGPENPMADPRTAEALKQAMQDPKFQEQMRAMQEAMKRPEVKQQLAEMQAAMQNQALRQRMEELKNDPEFAEMFADIQKNGPSAVMKYYNDPRVLAKIGQKLGDVAPMPPSAAAAATAAGAGAAGPMAGAAEPAEPEINNMRDAAKFGDEEAVEDFIAIGKDLNEGDKEGRTPLHYATAFDRPTIARMLIDEGADLEAADTMNNTPLHYAAGYGRVGIAQMLLAGGANTSAKNNTGKTPYDLATIDSRNPINNDADLVAKLKP